eukprot:1834334-Pyramimonas_sp.AAC.1
MGRLNALMSRHCCIGEGTRNLLGVLGVVHAILVELCRLGGAEALGRLLLRALPETDRVEYPLSGRKPNGQPIMGAVLPDVARPPEPVVVDLLDNFELEGC